MPDITSINAGVTLLAAATAALPDNAALIADRNSYAFNTVYVEQIHATHNCLVTILESIDGTTNFIPIAQGTAGTVSGARGEIIRLPVGKYGFLKATVTSSTNAAASVNVRIRSQQANMY